MNMVSRSDTIRDRGRREIEFGPYRLTKDRVLHFPNGTQTQLSARLADVLWELAAEKGMVVSRLDIVEHCWPGEDISEESLTRAIADLRRVFRTQGHDCIETVYGYGYRLNIARSDVSIENLAYCQEAWQRMYQRQPATLASAEDLFNQVLEKDAGHLQAWLGLAQAQIHSMQAGYTTTMKSGHEARQFLEQALKIAPASTDALALKGLLLIWVDWDFKGGEALLMRARELAPDDYTSNQATAYYKLAIGQCESAAHHAESAVAARPLSATARAVSAFARWYGGDAETALRQARELRRIDARGAVSLGLAAIFEAALGVPAEAVSMAEQSFELLPESPVCGAIFAYTLARDGRTMKARALLESETKAGVRIGSTTMASPAWMELGEKESALAALHSGFATRCAWLLQMLNDPRIRSLDCEPMKSAIFSQPL